MKNFSLLLSLGINIFLSNCTSKSYPENMKAAERKQYYADYNNSRTAAEWNSMSKASEKQVEVAVHQPTVDAIQQADDSKSSVAFKIKNNSIIPQTIKVLDNTLDFKPFELRYVGFKAGTKAYLHQDKKQQDKYLFTVAASDEGRTFKIFE